MRFIEIAAVLNDVPLNGARRQANIHSIDQARDLRVSNLYVQTCTIFDLNNDAIGCHPPPPALKRACATSPPGFVDVKKNIFGKLFFFVEGLTPFYAEMPAKNDSACGTVRTHYGYPIILGSVMISTISRKDV